ncbi:hypothetical protein NMG60_11021846 [Bertholletia excelsa]
MSKGEESVVFYAPIPADPNQQNYVVLPVYPRRLRRPSIFPGSVRSCLGVAAVVSLLAVAAFLVFPSDPDLTLVRLNLKNFKVRTSPHLSLDLSLSLTVRVRNRDFFSLNYSSLAVSIGYRGRELGVVTSNGGRIRPRGSSYVDATLVLDGFQVIHDVVYLIEDLARGSIPFDTQSEVKGWVKLFFLEVPIKARISCEVDVSTDDQTIIRQNCYPV